MMADFDASTWIVLALVGGWCVLSMLHVLAHRFERERSLHDLKLRVNSLRGAYAARLAEMAAREYGSAAPIAPHGSPAPGPILTPAPGQEVIEVVEAVEVVEAQAQSQAA